jgi:hypothetical protein
LKQWPEITEQNQLVRSANAVMMLPPAVTMVVTILRLRRASGSKNNRQRKHTQKNSFHHGPSPARASVLFYNP